MSRRLVSITLDNLSDLPVRCRGCAFWELDAVACELARETGDTALEKEAWVSDTLLEWGSCGQLIYVDERPAGYVLYAPPAYVPRSLAFPTSPVGQDAVLLMTAHVRPEFRGGGLARMLFQGVARDVVRRGVRAVEAFGRTGLVNAGRDQSPEQSLGADGSCLVPVEYLLAVGFKTIRAHPRTPRLRLDVRTTASWREDVESALERLLGTIHAPVLSR